MPDWLDALLHSESESFEYLVEKEFQVLSDSDVVRAEVLKKELLSR